MVDSSIIPKVDSSKSNLTVGGVVGENRENANVTGIQVKVGVTTDSSALIGLQRLPVSWRYCRGQNETEQ